MILRAAVFVFFVALLAGLIKSARDHDTFLMIVIIPPIVLLPFAMWNNGYEHGIAHKSNRSPR